MMILTISLTISSDSNVYLDSIIKYIPRVVPHCLNMKEKGYVLMQTIEYKN